MLQPLPDSGVRAEVRTRREGDGGWHLDRDAAEGEQELEVRCGSAIRPSILNVDKNQQSRSKNYARSRLRRWRLKIQSGSDLSRGLSICMSDSLHLFKIRDCSNESVRGHRFLPMGVQPLANSLGDAEGRPQATSRKHKTGFRNLAPRGGLEPPTK